MESADWCPGDCKKYFEALFRGDTWSGYWLVYDDGGIQPMGWALIMEADMERLGTNRTLTTSALTLEPAPTPTIMLKSAIISPSNITREPLRYDGRGIVISGQTYLEGSGPRLLVDGKSGVNIASNTAGLQKELMLG